MLPAQQISKLLPPRLQALWHRPALWQTIFLTSIDGVTNLLDYAFHIYLARVLLAADFAILQTVNTAVLILITAFAFLQPIVARYSSQAHAQQYPDEVRRGIFQFYFRRALLISLPLMGVLILARKPVAAWLNIPETAVFILAFILLLAILRPIVAGQLQGESKFFPFGLTRLSNALSRFLLAILLITVLHRGLPAALLTIPIGGGIALFVGLHALGRPIWRTAAPLPAQFRHSKPLLLTAFLALIAYMSLLSMDLIWVNRLFSAQTAGIYATAVLLRRVLILLPAAVIVVMYPRAVAQVAQGRLPDKLLAQTAAIVVLPTLLLTAVYAQFGSTIIQWTFGDPYSEAAPLLLGMGIGMVGFALTAVWLNFYLATHPRPYVLLLIAVALLQITLYSQLHNNIATIIRIFTFSGWLTAIGGFLIYVVWLRPYLRKQQTMDNT